MLPLLFRRPACVSSWKMASKKPIATPVQSGETNKKKFRKLTREEERELRWSLPWKRYDPETSIFNDPKKNQSIEEAQQDCSSTNFGQK